MTSKINKHIIRKKKHYAWVWSLLVLVLFVIFDLSPFGGNIRFYTAWSRCGVRPVATLGSGFLNDGAIHYIVPPKFSLVRPSIEYYCTTLQAEQAGYSADPDRYDFPHLKQGDVEK